MNVSDFFWVILGMMALALPYYLLESWAIHNKYISNLRCSYVLSFFYFFIIRKGDGDIIKIIPLYTFYFFIIGLILSSFVKIDLERGKKELEEEKEEYFKLKNLDRPFNEKEMKKFLYLEKHLNKYSSKDIE